MSGLFERFRPDGDNLTKCDAKRQLNLVDAMMDQLEGHRMQYRHIPRDTHPVPWQDLNYPIYRTEPYLYEFRRKP